MKSAKKTARKTERKPLEPWQQEDAGRLRKLWDERPLVDERKQISQEAFGNKYGLGGQAGTWQYLSGHIPLNIRAAVCFAAELACDVEDISPILAAQRNLQRPEVSAATIVVEGIERLSEPQRHQIFDFVAFQFQQAADNSVISAKDAARFVDAARKWEDAMRKRIEVNQKAAASPGLHRSSKAGAATA